MSRIKSGTVARLGLRVPAAPERAYELIALAFPWPPGSTAWRCMYPRCAGGKGPVWNDMTTAELMALSHVRDRHNRG